jgi:hypothetical protein
LTFKDEANLFSDEATQDKSLLSISSYDRSLDFGEDYSNLCFIPGMTMEGLVNEQMFHEDFWNLDDAIPQAR